MADLLEIDSLTSGYGSAVVLDRISFAMDTGDSLALLGRNGMGKTTLLASIMGLTKVHAGEIRPVERSADCGLRSRARHDEPVRYAHSRRHPDMRRRGTCDNR